MSMSLVTLLYLVASICFIQALKGLSHPTTSIRGNLFGMTGMAIAVVTTAALILKLSNGSMNGMAILLAALVLGGNLLSIQADYDHSDRYSEYIVSGQRAGKDSDHGKQAAHVKQTVKDDGVKRYRPYHEAADGQVDAEKAARQAEWERQTRAARSATFDATVAGWLQEDGKVWDINQLVQVNADAVGITGELLIAAVEYSLDADTGETTKLNLKRPNKLLTRDMKS